MLCFISKLYNSFNAYASGIDACTEHYVSGNGACTEHTRREMVKALSTKVRN